MTRNQRLGLVAAAVVVAIVAVVLLRSSDDETSSKTTTRSQTQPTPGRSTTPTNATTTPANKPSPPLLTADDPQDLKFKKGDTIAFRVRNPEAEEVHVHGYDISKELAPGKTVTMSFKADIEGIFEIELEQSSQPLGTLTVEP